MPNCSAAVRQCSGPASEGSTGGISLLGNSKDSRRTLLGVDDDDSEFLRDHLGSVELIWMFQIRSVD